MNGTGAWNGLLADVRDVAGYLWERGWAEANGGNLSIRLLPAEMPEAFHDNGPWKPLPRPYPALSGERFLVTGSGKRFRDLARTIEPNACVVELSPEADAYRIVWGGQVEGFRPTSELSSHLALHESLRAEARNQRLVLHTHPTELIALSHLSAYKNERTLGRALVGMMPEVKVLLPRGVGWVPYILTGTVALAEATQAALSRGFEVILWEMHGALAVAKDVQGAFDLLETANKGAAILLHCLAVGEKTQGLSDDQLAELSRAFGLDA